MLQDINPKVYAISTERFVFVNKSYLFKGKVAPNAHVDVYINGVLNNHTNASGDGTFQLYLTLVNDENEVVVVYS